jgi:transposase-like protein
MRCQGDPSELKSKAIQLRVKHRRSLREIHKELGVSKSTLSIWLNGYPLTKDELFDRESDRKARMPEGPKDNTLVVKGSPSKFYSSLSESLSPHQMGRLAEAAILFRLTLHGFRVFRSVADGDRADFVVLEDGRCIKLQVKCVKEPNSHGLPVVKLWRVEGFQKRKRYTENELDFIVGYWLYNDTAYVYSMAEVRANLTGKTVTLDGAEAWYKLKDTPPV